MIHPRIVIGLIGAAWFAPAPAVAMDCARASTASEKAICGNPGALAADNAMAMSYSALRATLDAGQRAGLLASQAQWLTSRDSDCSDKAADQLGACLRTESERRRAFLAGAPESGPGAPGRIVPSFRYQKGSKRRAELAYDVLKFEKPVSGGQIAFNAAVAHLFDDISDPDANDPAADRYYFGWRMRLTYASPQFVSAFAQGAFDTGGAHPNSGSVGVNINMIANAPATFAELVDEQGAAKVFAFCDDAVARQKKQKNDGQSLDADEMAKLRKDVADVTGDLKSWRFSADSATVTYDPYSVGSYAEGSYECVIPMAFLRAAARPGFPLPR